MKKPITTLDKILLSIIYATALILAFSCTTTKHIATNRTTIDSTVLNEKSDSIRNLQIENQRLSQEIHELQYAGVVFDSARCPPSVINVPEDCNVDSLLMLLSIYQNKVKILADGTIEAQGKIKSAYYTKDKLSKVIAELQRVNDSLKVVKAKTETVVKTEVVTKEKKVKRSFLNMWWLYLIFFIGGWVVRHRYGTIFKL